MSSQRPFFLSTFFAAFRQQTPASLTSASASTQQPNKHTTQSSASTQQTSAATPRTISSTAAASASSQATSPQPRSGGVMSQLPLHSPRHHHHHHSTGVPIPQPPGHHDSHGRRRGSDSSSEGFRDALGAEKLYIGGRTAAGEERFFKLGVVRRVRSGDRLSLDRLSL
ncbi:hypothetical protein F5144DRAFT_574370 [Chaetomium tenue]|uniref:Uncharacterized protein n=1 Tax=Chaetomium tenue TaxID=1854479 RepID=A0ACB7PCI3_9PEZI|nr:hypothetical protein F5144DRAFT_574370 [Chaetomium globosum]